ncbi:DUF1917-domain-containing protein [Melanomma pulvis-pyrius CBS 109.77]|uniref:DUF1917-domain-containing protein n=1 Tax=Melanomma pulvis-pyrius CBS 109.77 TaxID=1314802 RepID=A0A6A6XWF1_9PLEO|nr:DUF1917-domain-containing protein [Melanomma pulvis-pyrius CBS 109.77]
MVEEELVSGDGWISDDSSFYGDEDEQEQQLSLCQEFSPIDAWRARSKDLNALLSKKRTMPPPDLFNDREGCSDSWQLGESVADFITRLPPLTTPGACYEWIWVSNPYRDSHGDSKWPKLDDFRPRGFALLEKSIQTRLAIQRDYRTIAGTVTRLLNQEAKLLEQHLYELATETNILSGKWMLFPALQDVTRVWRLVVEAVINNRLGPTAKVAPDDGKPNERLICVYTKDFRDKNDVLRVLQELFKMGLVGPGRGIYYKSDLYTLLDIYGKNAAEYGLQASLYSSQKMLAEAKLSKPSPIPQKKQTTLNGVFRSSDHMDID